jgi:aromatic ring-opening dioxygenase catalytic subunit (LigB family)
MLTSHALLVPHLPTLLLDEHRRHHTLMLDALTQASERLLADSPAAVVVLSTRWNAPGPFLVDEGKRHRTVTDYSGFGVEVRYDCDGHPALARALVTAGRKARVRVGAGQRGADSGVTVPMHFLAPARSMPVVPLSVGHQTAAECRAWGNVVRTVLAAWPDPVAFVVGGLLSYNEHAWSLNREVPESRAFDDATLDALRRGDWSALAGGGPALIEKAQPELGLRHLEVLRGFLAYDAPGEVRAYETVPGVGAALVEFPVNAPVESPERVDHDTR